MSFAQHNLKFSRNPDGPTLLSSTANYSPEICRDSVSGIGHNKQIDCRRVVCVYIGISETRLKLGSKTASYKLRCFSKIFRYNSVRRQKEFRELASEVPPFDVTSCFETMSLRNAAFSSFFFSETGRVYKRIFSESQPLSKLAFGGVSP